MDCSPGRKAVGVVGLVGRWPLVEVRLWELNKAII